MKIHNMFGKLGESLGIFSETRTSQKIYRALKQQQRWIFKSHFNDPISSILQTRNGFKIKLMGFWICLRVTSDTRDFGCACKMICLSLFASLFFSLFQISIDFLVDEWHENTPVNGHHIY